MKKRLLVFSIDAMVSEDTDYLRTCKNFSKYLAGGSEVRKIRTVYPSVTYPAHVSMTTGCYPGKTGVFSNYKFTTNSKEDTWQWFAESNKARDIFTAAKEAGYSTGSVAWPVTGRHPSIDCLIDEYWMPQKGDTLAGSFERAGSSPEMISIIEANEGLLAPSYKLTGRKNFCVYPNIDDFFVKSACDIIRKYSPEVMFIHEGNIDHGRHTNGVFGSWLAPELDRVDDYIGQIGRALEDSGELENTDFFLVSDHGQRDIKRTVKPNVLLAKHGYIDLSEKGRPVSYRAYCLSNAMSSLVYLHDPDDKATHDELYSLLCELRDEGIYGFNEVLTREEAAERYHLDGDFAFVLESDGYTSFSDSCKLPYIAPLDLTDFRFGHATHGYMPEKGPQPTLIAKGPHIRSGVTVENRNIVDEAPTYARILGVSLPDAQGYPIEEILDL